MTTIIITDYDVPFENLARVCILINNNILYVRRACARETLFIIDYNIYVSRARGRDGLISPRKFYTNYFPKDHGDSVRTRVIYYRIYYYNTRYAHRRTSPNR